MKSSTKKLLYGAAASAVLLGASAAPAFAIEISTGSRAAVNASTTAKVQTNAGISTSTKSDADAKISARVDALNKLMSRMGDIKKLSSDQKNSLDSSINASINDMMSLKAKLDADTDAATFKEDLKSITKDYRIYLLVMPRGRIIAAADRIQTITGLMASLSTKFQTKISSGQAAGKDVTSANTSLSDYNAKVADANTQAQAAVSEVTNLNPDNGDKTVFQANLTALKDARAKIRTATSDLKTARQDAANIVKILKSWNISTSTTASSTTPTASH